MVRVSLSTGVPECFWDGPVHTKTVKRTIKTSYYNILKKQDLQNEQHIFIYYFSLTHFQCCKLFLEGVLYCVVLFLFLFINLYKYLFLQWWGDHAVCVDLKNKRHSLLADTRRFCVWGWRIEVVRQNVGSREDLWEQNQNKTVQDLTASWTEQDKLSLKH